MIKARFFIVASEIQPLANNQLNSPSLSEVGKWLFKGNYQGISDCAVGSHQSPSLCKKLHFVCQLAFLCLCLLPGIYLENVLLQLISLNTYFRLILMPIFNLFHLLIERRTRRRKWRIFKSFWKWCLIYWRRNWQWIFYSWGTCEFCSLSSILNCLYQQKSDCSIPLLCCFRDSPRKLRLTR